MKRPLRSLLLAGAVGLGIGGGPATAAWAATSAPVHRTTAAKTVSAPEPGQGWLTGRRQRLLAVWILLDVGAVLLWYGSDTVRPARLLGSLGARQTAPTGPIERDPAVGGIGRFARHRDGPPNRL
ncbi:MAG: hypothetical protein ACYCTI_06410 [Acidimicrobiales bacterium]